MSNQIAIKPEPALPMSAWPQFERVLLSACQYIPGLGKVSASDRVRTAFQGSVWTMVGYGGSQLIRLASMVILARHLLGPAAFGLVALVNVFITGLNLISDLGIGTDVIQHRRGDEPVFVNTAFLIGAGRGVILWLMASLLAHPFASLYHQPAVFPLALMAASSVLITGLTSGSVYMLTRHVRLGRLTVLRVIAEAAGLLVSVVWAIVSPTAWSLVAGRVATDLFFTVGTHFVGDQRASLAWDPSAAKDIMAFGMGMFASSATYFLAGEAERLVVGKFIDLVMLGCFSLALSITAAATGVFQRLLSQVFYPMIASSARANRDLAASQFRKSRLALLVLTGMMAITFIIGGKWIVALLLGPQFVATGWILQLLGFRAALEIFTSATTQMLFALGSSKYAAAGNITKLVFLGVGLTIAFGKYGFREAVCVLAIAPIFAYLPLLYGIRKHFRVAFWTEVFASAIFLSAAGAAALLWKLVS